MNKPPPGLSDFCRPKLLLSVLACLPVLLGGCTAPRQASHMDHNVVYGRVGKKELVMDLIFPKTATTPHPVVINIHGGAWTEGSKSLGTSWLAAPELVRRGYVFASVYYRLAPRYKFPAQIEDVKCAVRYLRAHARDYNLDPGKFVALGSSAGGHLAALLGTADASAGFDTSGGWTNESSRVQGVVDMFGHADLVHAVKHRERVRLIARSVFGSRTSEEILRRFSPVTYVTPDDPPFLLIHGDEDGLVPLDQSRLMKAALDKAGVPAELIIVPGTGHGLYLSAGLPSPATDEVATFIADFADRVTGRSKQASAAAPATTPDLPRRHSVNR